MLRLGHSSSDLGHVIAIIHYQYLPSVRFVSLLYVLREAQGSVAINGDLVVVVQDDQLAQTKMTRQGTSLATDALLQAPITANNVSVMPLPPPCHLCYR